MILEHVVDQEFRGATIYLLMFTSPSEQGDDGGCHKLIGTNSWAGRVSLKNEADCDHPSIRFSNGFVVAASAGWALPLFCASTYIGLQRYLQKSLEETLVKQAAFHGERGYSSISIRAARILTMRSRTHSPRDQWPLIRIRARGKRILYLRATKMTPALILSECPHPTTGDARVSPRNEMSDGHELLLHACLSRPLIVPSPY